MKTIYSCNGNFRIGRVGENNACEVFIPKEGFADIYGAGVYTLVYDRPDGECYECPVEERSAFIVWTPTAADTAVAGRGHIELVYRAGEVVAKGKIYDILIDISLSAAGEAPETEPEVYVFPAAETADGARLARLCQKTIYIGRVGENKATVANVRKGPEMASYEGAFGLLFQRPGEVAPYLVEAVDKGEYLEWIITNTDTAIPGRGKLQMIYSGNGTVAKGDIYDTMCDVSLDGPGDPPEPWSGYVEEVLEAAAKIENMTASASVTSEGEPGVSVTKTETEDGYNLDFAFTGIGAETALEMNLNSMTLDDGKIAYLFVAANVSSAEELAALNPTLVRLNYAGRYLIFNPPYQKSITGTIKRTAEDWSTYTMDFGELGRINNTGTLSVRIPQAMMSRFTAMDANELTLRTWAQVFSAETQAQMRQNIGAASESDLQDHVDNDNVHVTAADKNIWDAKYSKPTGGIPMNDLSQDVQEAINSGSVVELYAIGTVLEGGVLCYGFSAEDTGITAKDLEAMKPTLMRIWWNHNDPALTDGFDRYAVGVLRKMQNQWTAYIVDFGELGRFRATAFPRFYVPKAFFDTYFTATAATVETLHSWAQTFDAAKQAQMRANIDVPSTGDLTAHTGDTDVHFTGTEKADMQQNIADLQPFVVRATAITGSAYFNLDKTYSEILAAILAGKRVYIDTQEEVFPYTTIVSLSGMTMIIFGATVSSGNNLVTRGIAVAQNVAMRVNYTSGLVTSVNGNDGDVSLDAVQVGAVPANTVGVAGGVASLDSNGKVPAGQLPSIPSKTSDLTNDSDFITETAVDTKLETKADSAGANANYAAKLTASIPYGECDSTSTATAFTATVPGITELRDGVCMLLKNGVVTSASGFTININGLGAKGAYTNLAAATRDTTLFNVNYTMLFIYSEDIVSGGGWICYRGYDANTNTIGYQVRVNSGTLPMKSVTYRYRLLFTAADQAHYVPATNSTSTNATATRTVCQDPIDPFGPIVYYGATASVAAGSRPSATVLWQQYALNLGYSFNRSGAALTLDDWKPVYVKAAPQTDGSAVIDSTTPYVQALPTAADGKIYIFLGIAYNATNIELNLEHPVYYHDGSGIKLWTNYTETDPTVPAWAKQATKPTYTASEVGAQAEPLVGQAYDSTANDYVTPFQVAAAINAHKQAFVSYTYTVLGMTFCSWNLGVTGEGDTVVVGNITDELASATLTGSLSTGNWVFRVHSLIDDNILGQYATTQYVDDLVGDIETALQALR